MASFKEAFSAIGSGTGSSIWMIVLIVIGCVIGFLLLGGLAWWYYFKKRWNLRAEIKLTRSDGRLTNAEWGKAMYNAKQGVCFVKRPGLMQSAIPVEVFDIRKYIQGDNIVSFVQLSADVLKPILNDSWEEFEEEEPTRDKFGNIKTYEDGTPVHERAALMTIKVDSGKNKAWRAAWTQAAKQAYSLKSFFTQFQTPIAIAIVIIAVFVGFAIVWTRLGSIC